MHPHNLWLTLSIPIALLAGLAAGLGVLDPQVYAGDAEHFATQAAAQDVVTLVVAVPAVLALGWAAWRGSLPARLVWHGVVFYFVYTYTVAAFHVQFNVLFLVYTSVLACSVAAFVGGVASLGWPVPVTRFGGRWPRRGVIVLLAVVVTVFLVLWLSEIVPALLEGTPPASVAQAGTPTSAVHVLDLSLLLPGATLTAVWLGRRQARGYVLATALMGFIVVLGLALAAMIVGLSQAGLEADALVAGAFLGVAGWTAGLLGVASRSVQRAVHPTRLEASPPPGGRSLPTRRWA